MANTQLPAFIRLLMPGSGDGIIHALADRFERRALKKGEALFRAGEVCDAFYFVESGYLCTSLEKDGEEIQMYFHLEGSVAADYKHAKAGTPSPFTLKAGEKSEVCVLKMKQLEELCDADEEIRAFGRRLVAHLALDLQTSDVLLKMYTPAERYAFIEQQKPELLQRVSLSRLASYLGMSRRTLTRIRQKGVF